MFKRPLCRFSVFLFVAFSQATHRKKKNTNCIHVNVITSIDCISLITSNYNSLHLIPLVLWVLTYLLCWLFFAHLCYNLRIIPDHLQTPPGTLGQVMPRTYLTIQDLALASHHQKISGRSDEENMIQIIQWSLEIIWKPIGICWNFGLESLDSHRWTFPTQAASQAVHPEIPAGC